MHVTEITPARHWLHVPSGRKASIYGACPWTSEADRPNWRQITSGFVPHMSDGTVGACRPPFPTLHDAAEWANRVNAQERARYTAHGLAYPEKRDECRQLAERIPTFHTTPAAA